MRTLKLSLSLLTLSLLFASLTSAHASAQIRTRTDFIRSCLSVLVPDAIDSLKIECVAKLLKIKKKFQNTTCPQ